MDDNMRKVKTVLQRYSFESKMALCQYYSLKIMDCSRINLEKEILPWYLEIIVLLSVNYGSWKEDTIDRDTFIKLLNNLHSINFLEEVPKEDIFKKFFLIAAATQFRLQRGIFIELYRYHYYFSYDNDEFNLKKEFYKKFGCDYLDFCLFSYGIWTMFVVKKESPSLMYDKNINEIMIKLSLKYRIPFEILSIKFEDYKKLLENMNIKLEDFYSVTRPSYAFPFIIKNDVIYLPLPHLLIISITEFLMIRLTEKNNSLRNKIGNIVFEKYLYDILYDSNYFEEIYKEQSYIYKKQEKKTIDVMCRIGNDILFFDRKSTVPGNKISIIDKRDIDNNISVMSKACVQMYKHLKLKYPTEYNPFKNNYSANDENKWGIVVVESDSFIPRQDIYDEAKRLLEHGGIDNVDYQWMTKHIIVTDISCIESFYCYNPKEFLEELKDGASNNKIHNFITVSKGCSLTNKKILDFNNKLIEDIKKDIECLL